MRSEPHIPNYDGEYIPDTLIGKVVGRYHESITIFHEKRSEHE
jgi:hypothetical protein